MSRSRIQELAMKIVDVDETPQDPPFAGDMSATADTEVLPELRPEVLGDPVRRRTKALVHASLFKGPGEAPRIGAYQVLKRLGEGGMGVVYAAYDDQLERKVALKLIRSAAMCGPEGRARTLREARALARVSHPNVVHVYQVGEVDDEIFVAMEFLTGPTLQAWLAAQPRAWGEVLAVFRQAGAGLAAAHQQGVVHRDFKPANVIVGDDGRVRVLDFGLAHFSGEAGEAGTPALAAAGGAMDVLLTQTGAVLGTPAYMAAEQFAGGRGDTKTDQFSFCAALYEGLYGKRPFTGGSLVELALAVNQGRMATVTVKREVPGWLHQVVLRGLSPRPEARWPSMAALLVALTPPASRRWGRVAAVTGGLSAALLGGFGYVYRMDSAGDPQQMAAQEQATAQARAELVLSQDEKLLGEAEAALERDPVAVIRALARLAGDAPATLQKARFLARAAEARGLPAELLRAGEQPLAEVRALAGGGFVGRDELGAVWAWKMSEKTGVQILPPGSASKLLMARDVPVWAVLKGQAVQVFGGERAQTVAVGAIEAQGFDWRLASDGGTLVATRVPRPGVGADEVTLYLWDLTRPGSPARTLALGQEMAPLIAEDASLVVSKTATGMRVLRSRDGTETTLKYAGRPWALAADGRFVVARPDDEDQVMDVLEIATGKARRVEAVGVVVLAGDEVLFEKTSYGRPQLRRESLASGAVAWRLGLPAQAGLRQQTLVADPVHEQFAVVVGEQWGVGDLRGGELRSFLAVPKDRSPQWSGAGALMVAIGSELRVYRTAEASVQMPLHGSGCGLAPGGGFAIVAPKDLERGAFTRVELSTRQQERFRCATPPPEADLGGGHKLRVVSSSVDDAGQVALFGADGWSCWWDEQHGARAGAASGGGGRYAHVALPRGVALATGSEVSLWSGPEARTQGFLLAGGVHELQVDRSGTLLAARSERGVELLRIGSGAVESVVTEATPRGPRELLAGAMAWGPDGRLALLDSRANGLLLTVWELSGAPREVDRIALTDSPGRPSNLLGFTPAGTGVVVSDRETSLRMVTLGSHESRSLATPKLFGFHMRGDTDALGVDASGVPILLDFAADGAVAMTPDPEEGFNTKPPLRGGVDGSLWGCALLGPGSLVEVAGLDATPLAATRERVARLAAGL